MSKGHDCIIAGVMRELGYELGLIMNHAVCVMWSLSLLVRASGCESSECERSACVDEYDNE